MKLWGEVQSVKITETGKVQKQWKVKAINMIKD